ncbi:MAG: phosphoglucosamine mutase [Bryobacterales bacterium]|nr:phosphoglucosamine mutase [Bryobacterales bacterium]
MARTLFGTDGIRGVAGQPPLDARTAFAVGFALGELARHLDAEPAVLIGMDTRESGPWLAESVAGGLHAQGVHCHFAGVLTTPGVAYLTRTGRYVAGVMISASHNPFQDNGIKVFSHAGLKFPDEREELLEASIHAFLRSDAPAEALPLQEDRAFDEQYMGFLASTMPVGLTGIRMVVDGGNGAAYRLGPEVLRRLGAEVVTIHCQPNGRNINLDCGALHLESLCEAVVREKADLGVAFDGDADRALFVDGQGKVVDGDGVLYLCGLHYKQRNRLHAASGLPAVVATVMSNLGLEVALREAGVGLLRTAVGDKYVLQEMLASDLLLGGEQSGHLIFREYATTGDGILSCLRVLEVMRDTGKTLRELVRPFAVFPQRLVNIRVTEKRPFAEIPTVQAEIEGAEQELGNAGRVLVRYSGTEPLARVMIEARLQQDVDRLCERIAAAIRQEIGAE